jgi:hypothetical protein
MILRTKLKREKREVQGRIFIKRRWFEAGIMVRKKKTSDSEDDFIVYEKTTTTRRQATRATNSTTISVIELNSDTDSEEMETEEKVSDSF